MGRRSTRQAIALSDEDRARLEHVANTPRSVRKHVWRARIVLEPGSGCGPAGTMRRTGLSKPTVWCRRGGRGWSARHPEGERPRAAPGRGPSGCPATSSASASTRPTMPSSFRQRRVRTRTPPVRVDVRTGCRRSGGRKRPLPVTPGHAGTRTHDLPARGPRRRHRQGRVDRHRSQEFLAFPDPVAEGIAPGNPVHVIPDSVPSHGSAGVRTWPKGRLDRAFRFTPTSASRTNAVEGFFSKLSRQGLKNAVFDSLDACVTAIEGCIAQHDANDARPFRWSRKPEDPSKRAREDTGGFGKWHQMHKSKH